MGLRAWIGKLRRRWARASDAESLYSRITGKEVLHHDVRRSLLQALKRQPGLSFPELKQQCGLAAGTVEWHLDKLEEENFITASKDGRTRRYFPTETPPEMKEAMLQLRHASRRELVSRVLRAPGQTPQGELATRMGLSHATVHHHAKRLMEAGLLEKQKDGRTVAYSVPDDARKTVEKALNKIPPTA